MDYPTTQSTLHIELTDKCQAACPMCARNVNGGIDRDFVGQYDVSLNQFKEWFPKEWLATLTNFYACGNYGDPIIAKDCLEIFEYVRACNPTVRMAIHTNGSARSTQWWKDLAIAMGPYQEVCFGIDGFASSHVLYRRGTQFDKIIENAKAYISSGGYATIDSLVFEHNQYEKDEFEAAMLTIGFSKVNFKITSRFYDLTEFPVYDKTGNIEYTLKPVSLEHLKPKKIIPIKEIATNISIWTQRILPAATVKPRCVDNKEIYVDARGNVFPCCWVGSEIIEDRIKEVYDMHKLRNLLIENTKRKISHIPNLQDAPITELELWKGIDHWFYGDDKTWTCVKNCS